MYVRGLYSVNIYCQYYLHQWWLPCSMYLTNDEHWWCLKSRLCTYDYWGILH